MANPGGVLPLIEAGGIQPRLAGLQLQVGGSALMGPSLGGVQKQCTDPVRAVGGMHGKVFHPSPLPEAYGEDVHEDGAPAHQLASGFGEERC